MDIANDEFVSALCYEYISRKAEKEFAEAWQKKLKAVNGIVTPKAKLAPASGDSSEGSSSEDEKKPAKAPLQKVTSKAKDPSSSDSDSSEEKTKPVAKPTSVKVPSKKDESSSEEDSSDEEESQKPLAKATSARLPLNSTKKAESSSEDDSSDEEQKPKKATPAKVPTNPRKKSAPTVKKSTTVIKKVAGSSSDSSSDYYEPAAKKAAITTTPVQKKKSESSEDDSSSDEDAPPVSAPIKKAAKKESSGTSSSSEEELEKPVVGQKRNATTENGNSAKKPAYQNFVKDKTVEEETSASDTIETNKENEENININENITPKGKVYLKRKVQTSIDGLKELMVNRITKRERKDNEGKPFNWLAVLVGERINSIQNPVTQNEAAWEIQTVIQKHVQKDLNEHRNLLGACSSS